MVGASSVVKNMLKEKLQADIKDALKSGNAQKRLVLSLVMSAIKTKELEKRGKLVKSGEAEGLEEKSQLTDEEIIEVLSSEIKKRKDSIEYYEKGRREELAQKERDELNILMGYMPKQMSEDEIRNEVKKVIVEVGAKDIKEMGKVLGILILKVKGKADGQTVSRIVKEELSN